MDLNKVKKYLQIYLDEVIEPKVNRELVGEDDEPIKIKVYDVKQKEHLPEEMVIFLDMEPDWSHGSIIPHINTDIGRFMGMLGLRKLFTIAWNKRTQPIYEPR
jgi:hypothetical protein